MKEVIRHLPTKGVVLRYTNFNEADRMLTIFSPELGKISVLARGCRKAKSRFLAATELFCYGEYTLYRRGDFHIMTQANILDSFYEIRSDMDKLLYASYVINLTEEVVSPGQGDIHLFYLLLQTLSYFSYSDLEPELITHVFEIKLLDHIGYRPVLDKCIACGSNKGPYHFDIREGGLVCANCYNTNIIGNNIQMGTIKTIEYVLDMDMNRINVLKIPSSIKEELDTILKAYIEERIDKKLKSRKFIDDFKGKNRKR